MPAKRLLKNVLLFCSVFCSGMLYAQNKVITGKVTDDNNNPLQGVTIVIKGAATGVATNAAGDFSISVPATITTLTISYVGYESVDQNIRNKTSLNVKLQPSNSKMTEVVVVGYGTQRRKDITGSVASIGGNAIKNQPMTNVTEAIQGRAAGVEVIKSSGAPDATPTIVIRGLSSLNQPQPLYIVDGIRVPGDNINVQDIATIDILKDASAASIYGAAAAGGVIIITTKKGTGAKPTINFNVRYGVTTPKLVKLLDKSGYIRLENILNPQFFTGATKTDTLANTDWVKNLYGSAYESNYNLSVGGSSPVVNYLFSGFYNKQKGIYVKNSSDIAGARINTDFKLSNWIKIGEQIALSQRKTAPPVGSEAQIHNAPFRTLPIIPVYKSTGGWGVVPPGYGIQFGGPNPVGAVNSADAQNYKNNLQANVYAEIKLPLHLMFRTNFGYSYYHESQDYFQNSFNFGTVVNNINSLNKTSIESDQILSNYVLSYDQSFGKHNISALAGYEQIQGKYNIINVTQSYVGIPGYSFLQTSQTGYSVAGKYDPNALIKSFFGRLNYNFNSLYYISGSVRQDANFTVFGPNKQKGVFPAASAGWNISSESFFKPILPVINALKLRGSYGLLGNSNIAPYSYVAAYSQFLAGGGLSSGGQNFSPGGPLVIANSINSIPNPNLHWETIYETNIGLDGEALKGKLYYTIEWYNKKTKDMLYRLPLPLSSGFTQSYLTNIGTVSSKGLDVLLGYRSKAGNVGYDVSATLGFNKNKVKDLDGIEADALFDGYNYYSNGDAAFSIMSNQPITETKAGLPFGSYYGYKVLGIFKTDAEAAASAQPNAKAGDLIFAHDSKNGTTLSDKDKQVIGNPNPKLVYGATIRLNYKGFDVAMLFNGVAGVDLFNGVKAYQMYPFADGNTSDKVFGASFLGGNGLTSQPRLGVVNTNGSFTLDPNKNYTSVNSYFVENGAYVKLKNLQIGYTFPTRVMDKAKIKSARLFVMANNLFTITKYEGLDPELSGAFSPAGYAGVTTRGLDAVSAYPHTRIYSIGLDVNF